MGVFVMTNRLETGEVNTYQLTVDGGAKDFPVRITLAWTDPPGIGFQHAAGERSGYRCLKPEQR